MKDELTPMAGVLADVAAERQRQIDVHGHTLDRDQNVNHPGQLATAAAAHAVQAGARLQDPDIKVGVQPPSLWPFKPETWNPHEPRAALITAMALLMAEVERVDALTD